MSQRLPLFANLEWLKKTSKERLEVLRASDPAAKLSDAQLLIAREYGFSSWRKLKSHVEQLRDTLGTLAPPETRPPEATEIPADDPDLTQLISAVQAGDIQIAGEFLKRRPQLVRAKGPEGQTPLHVAAQCNDVRLGLLLLGCGADREATFGQSGHTPLSWAVTCHALDFARALVKLGSQPDLFCAAGIGDLIHIQRLFNESGLIPHASRTGSSRMGADGKRLPCPPLTANEQISDALYIACRNGHVEVVRFLLTKQPDLAFRAYMGATPLHWAYFGGSQEVIDLLEAAGADPTLRDETLRCTPRAFGICAPTNWGFFELVQARLKQDPTLAQIQDGSTSPLHEAARSGSVPYCRPAVGGRGSALDSQQ